MDIARRISFRDLAEADLPLLHGWLQQPHVAEWWGPAGWVDELRADFIDPAGAPGARRACIAWLDGGPLGFIQVYVVMGHGDGWWPDETDPGARGIDQFLANGDRLGQGLGSAMVRAFVARLFGDPAVTTVQTDPRPDNARAIAAYRKSGFRDVGLVETPDGAALLMRCTRASLAEGAWSRVAPGDRPG